MSTRHTTRRNDNYEAVTPERVLPAALAAVMAVVAAIVLAVSAGATWAAVLAVAVALAATFAVVTVTNGQLADADGTGAPARSSEDEGRAARDGATSP
jgi:uncharacterized membrane protein YphA (DoxX/SURF4 family)